ncbi:cation diffusion facilitator family transporter [Sporolactobacillus sp. CPB3-1]|uniref:Cation diffusion facilitator family transporter n=1 Tax=Sporolactobacillus mangiferae TaxID=2940498 RepID=A0ABT0MB21_9BACL|nr:cation diffusion facilitator family transporter [Sporolactobacillus mangiferae]MCL1631883.1 cation diffusion facilitator family transporter [Sporolactobacillus mangiferae]
MAQKSKLKHNHESGLSHHADNQTVMLFSFLIITGFMIVEMIGGLLSHSLALISDAGHMLSDAVSLGFSLIAMLVGAKVPVNNRKTFGYRRFEILAALFNGVLLLVISFWIVIEAILRIRRPVSVAGGEMMVIAFLGMLVNIVVAVILMRSREKDNLNVRSAFLHVIGDLLGSIGAIIASMLIIFFGWNLADPIASIVVSVIILKSGWGVARDAINILMESKPDHIDIEDVRRAIQALEGVDGVHDLHIWTITSGFFSLSCHVTVKENVNRDQLLEKIESLLGNYHLDHSTIQIESIHFLSCHSDCAHQKHG